MARIAPAPNPYELTEDQRRTLALADEFARKELAPLAKQMDDDECWPEGLFRRLGAAGYLGLTIPESEGGPGLDLFSSALVGQAFARWNQAVGLSWLAHENLCMNNVQRNARPGTEETLFAGSRRRNAGRRARPYRARRRLRRTRRHAHDGATRRGSLPPERAQAIYHQRLDRRRAARVREDFTRAWPQGHQRVPRREERAWLFGGAEARQDGICGSPTAELVFDDCRVPVANRVGEENAGVAIVMSGLDLERAVGATLSIGIAERCLQLALDYARQRKQFGRPIGDFQIIQAKLADMYTAIESMRVLAYRALAAVNVLEVGGGGRGGVHKLTAASILYCAEATSRVAADAVQIHGGSGYMWEMEVNRLYRACKLMEIGAGTSEVRRIIIAEELLRSGVAE